MAGYVKCSIYGNTAYVYVCILIDEKCLVHYQPILVLTVQQNVRILDIVIKVLVVKNFNELFLIQNFT